MYGCSSLGLGAILVWLRAEAIRGFNVIRVVGCLKPDGGSFYKGSKQGMRSGRAAFEFGMELGAKHERMVSQFCNFDQSAIGRKTR